MLTLGRLNKCSKLNLILTLLLDFILFLIINIRFIILFYSYSRTLEVLNRFDSFFNNGLSESERIRVMLLCGSDLLASFATPGVWIPDEISQIISSRFGIACLDREGVSSKDIIESNPLL